MLQLLLLLFCHELSTDSRGDLIPSTNVLLLRLVVCSCVFDTGCRTSDTMVLPVVRFGAALQWFLHLLRCDKLESLDTACSSTFRVLPKSPAKSTVDMLRKNIAGEDDKSTLTFESE